MFNLILETSRILGQLGVFSLVILLHKKAINDIIPLLRNFLFQKFLVSKDVTFVESQPFFGHSNLSLQGENHRIKDQVADPNLPILDLDLDLLSPIPTDSNNPTPNPIFPIDSISLSPHDPSLVVPNDY